MTTVNVMQMCRNNFLYSFTIQSSPYEWLNTNLFQPMEFDNDPVTEEEMVNVRISLAQLEQGSFSEIKSGSDDIELQRMLDSWKK